MFSELPLAAVVAIFLAAALVIGVAGVRMTALADVIADRTGLGEALVGAALLGGATSLSGVVTSVTAAATGHPELAVANAIGGIAAQTAFLAVGDFAHRRVNLEHAAASATNLAQAVLLVVMLAIPLLAATAPEVDVFGLHPATGVLLFTYGAGLLLARRIENQPMWRPRWTRETREDEPDAASMRGPKNPVLAVQFGAIAVAVGVAGWLVAQSGIQIAARADISESVVGALLTAVVTSLPELVTTVAAVRRGALQLAVGGIIGGNTFDVLFVAFSDIGYRGGSIYHAMGERSVFWITLTIVMTGVLLLGLLRREKHGVGNIGFESGIILLLYGGAVALQAAIG